MRWNLRLPITILALCLLPICRAPLALADEASDDPHDVPRWEHSQRYWGMFEWLKGGEVTPTWGDDGTSFTFTDEDGRRFRIEPSAPDGERMQRVEDAPHEPSEDEDDEPRIIRESIAAGVPPIREVHSPDGRLALSEIGPNLALRTLADGQIRALTDDGHEDLAWSVGAARWAPSGPWAVLHQIDRRGVSREPLVHWLSTPTQVSWIRIHRTGQTMEQERLFLLDARAERLVAIDTDEGSDERGYHLVNHGWSRRNDPEDHVFRFFQASRTWDRLRLREASLDGTVRTLMDERTDTFFGALRFWVHHMANTVHFLDKLPDEHPLRDHFLWTSEQEWSSQAGFLTLTLHAPDGKLIRRLSSGKHEVQGVVGITEEHVFYLVNSDPDRPYDTHLHRVGLDGQGDRRLTAGQGEHEIALSPSREVFLDTWSRPDKPPVVELRNAAGELLETLSEGKLEMPDDLAWVAPEPVTALAADGTTRLHGWLFKPHDFDPSKRYPVVDYIYNGPFITWAPQTFLGIRGVRARNLAELGFVVLVVDGRGTPERGKAFQDVVFHAFGQNEIPDHAAFVRSIARERPWIDLDRVGIVGGSWGGYMTVRGMLLEPDLYKVGVATNPVYDLYDHNGQSIEGYVGLPQDDPEGYAASSSPALADRLRGKLLLIHGAIDANANFSTTMKMAHALIQADRAFDLLVLPEQTHAFDGPARAYAQKAQARYLVAHLGSPLP